MVLGAGRETVDSAIDPAVGLILHKKVGDAVSAGEPLATLHVNDPGRLEDAVGWSGRPSGWAPPRRPPNP